MGDTASGRLGDAKGVKETFQMLTEANNCSAVSDALGNCDRCERDGSTNRDVKSQGG